MSQKIIIAQNQNVFTLPPPVDSQEGGSQTTIQIDGDFPAEGASSASNMDYVIAGLIIVIFLVAGIFGKSRMTVNRIRNKVDPSSASLSGFFLFAAIMVFGVAAAIAVVNKSLLSAPIFLGVSGMAFLLFAILAFTTGRK